VFGEYYPVRTHGKQVDGETSLKKEVGWEKEVRATK
jgi:hypothetical protein